MVNNGIFAIPTGERRISEPSTVSPWIARGELGSLSSSIYPRIPTTRTLGDLLTMVLNHLLPLVLQDLSECILGRIKRVFSYLLISGIWSTRVNRMILQVPPLARVLAIFLHCDPRLEFLRWKPLVVPVGLADAKRKQENATCWGAQSGIRNAKDVSSRVYKIEQKALTVAMRKNKTIINALKFGFFYTQN